MIYDGLVGQWKFNGNALDSSGSGNTGTVSGSTLTTGRTGDSNTAYNFANITDIITIPGLSSIFTQLGNYTVSCWVYQTTQDTSVMNIWNFGGGGSNRHNLAISSTYLSYQRYDGTSYTAKKGTNSLNNWMHVVCINNGGTLTLYKNTVSQTVTTNLYCPAAADGILRLGYPGFTTNGSQSLFGKIDDVMIWNRAITEAEVKLLYQGLGVSSEIKLYSNEVVELPVTSGLVAYYPLSTHANDISGNNRHATATNMTYSGESAIFSGVEANTPKVAFPSSVLQTGTCTFSLWVKPLEVMGRFAGRIFGSNTAARNGCFYGSSGKIYWYILETDGGAYSQAALANYVVGTWYHLVGLVDVANLKIRFYINGVLQQENTFDGTLSTSTATAELGWSMDSGNNYYNCEMREAAIYNRALTAAEISLLSKYSSLTSTKKAVCNEIVEVPVTTGLLSYYKLDTNSNDDAGLYNGTDTNMIYSSAGIFNGYDSKISLGNVNAGNFSAGFTFSAWIKIYKANLGTTNYQAETNLGATTGIASGNYWLGRQGVDTPGGKLISYVIPNTDYGSKTCALYGYQSSAGAVAGTYLIKDNITGTTLGSGNLSQKLVGDTDKRLNGTYIIEFLGHDILVEVYFLDTRDLYLDLISYGNAGYDGILYKGNALSILSWGAGVGSCRVLINGVNVYIGSASSFDPNNVWSHVTWTYDNINLKGYKNGVLIATTAYTTPIATNTNPFLVGEAGLFANASWWGEMKDLRLYNRALSAIEVKMLADTGKIKFINNGNINIKEAIEV